MVKLMVKLMVILILSLFLIYGALVVIALLPREIIPVEDLVGARGRFVTVDGHRIHYEKTGTGSPVILVHGFPGSTFTWRKLIPLLSEDYTVYALDLLGFGLSEKPTNGSYDFAAQAYLITGFMDAVGLSSAHLVGHSMGGIIVARAAEQSPARFHRLVIIDGSFYGAGPPPFMKRLFFPLDRITARMLYSETLRKKSLYNSYYNKDVFTAEVLEAYMLPVRTPNALNALAKMITDGALALTAPIADTISVPTLIVWGRNDTAYPPQDAVRLQQDIKNSQLRWIDQCGHMVQEEKPEELAHLLKSFLN